MFGVQAKVTFIKNTSKFCDNWSVFTWLTARTNIRRDRQTLTCRMITLLTMMPPEKEDLSMKKIMEIGAFVQILTMNKH